MYSLNPNPSVEIGKRQGKRIVNKYCRELGSVGGENKMDIRILNYRNLVYV